MSHETKKSNLNVKPFCASMIELAQTFDSGNPTLDRFLRDGSALNDWYGKTYVLLSEDEQTIIGYYNIGTGYVEQFVMNSRRKIGGSVHINCFALDKRFHKTLQITLDDGTKLYLSDLLLMNCLERIYELRSVVGFMFITLCSTKQGYNLYCRNDFYDLDKDMNFSIEEEISFNTEDDENFCAPMYYPLDCE